MTELKKLKATVIFTLKGLYATDALESALKDAIEVDFLYEGEEVLSIELEELDSQMSQERK